MYGCFEDADGSVRFIRSFGRSFVPHSFIQLLENGSSGVVVAGAGWLVFANSLVRLMLALSGGRGRDRVVFCFVDMALGRVG